MKTKITYLFEDSSDDELMDNIVNAQNNKQFIDDMYSIFRSLCKYGSYEHIHLKTPKEYKLIEDLREVLFDVREKCEKERKTNIFRLLINKICGIFKYNRRVK